jgi:PhnB protein
MATRHPRIALLQSRRRSRAAFFVTKPMTQSELREGSLQMAAVKPIPDGYPRVIPYLSVEGASAAIDFYTKVFDAKERVRMPAPEGKVGHAELEIGDSVIMLADVFPGMSNPSPKTLGGTPVSLMVYVENVDAVFDRAIKAGAKAAGPVENQFYGDRSGQFEDPFGHKWFVATHVEDVPPEEMEKRAAAAMAAG